MAFSAPFSSSLPPSTPDKYSRFSRNASTTPAGPPPSTTPLGAPPSSLFGNSKLGSARTKLNFGVTSFDRSMDSQVSEDLGLSTTSSNFPLPQVNGPRFASRNTFDAPGNKSFRDSDTNGHTAGSSRDFDSYTDDIDQDDDMEDSRTGFLDSRFSASVNSPAHAPAHKPFIYSNPGQAKRAKLDETWAQPPTSKPKITQRKNASVFPSIARDLASRSQIAMVSEPHEFIIESEDIVGRMYDQVREFEYDDDGLQQALCEISKDLLDLWERHTTASPSAQKHRRTSSIGPGESAPNIVKANFLGSLLLPLHHPQLQQNRTHEGSSPARLGTVRAFTPNKLKAKTPIPKVLFNWLSRHHNTQLSDPDAVRGYQLNPTASPTFWGVVQTSILRGNLSSAIQLLSDSDFNYARSAMEDGHEQPGYRGGQLQNIQKCVNSAIQLLSASPGVQNNDWDIKSLDWAMYRRQITAAITELENLAEGQNRGPEAPDQFQAPNFGIFNQRNASSFSQSTRMAESQVPWTIYQNLKTMYNIMLGDVSSILSKSQDWIEATVGLTAWWDGADDSDISSGETNLNRSVMKRSQSQAPRSVDSNTEEAYLRRLDYSFANVTENLGDKGFQVNSMNFMEVGLASVFEGNIEGVLEMLQTWSVPIASAVAEVASFGGWLETSVGSKPMPGFNHNDLMVLSYGKNEKPLRKDDILINYAMGLFDRKPLECPTGARDGWEVALEVLSRLDDQEIMKTKVTELLDRVPLETSEHMDKVVLLCAELGFNDEGRKVSERYGDKIAESSEEYGTALICYARAHSYKKVKNVVDLLTSFCLVRSTAYPPASELDDQLRSLLHNPGAALSAIAAVDQEAAGMLQFYFCGYAAVRRFYDIRDEEVHCQKRGQPKYRPLARKRAAAETLVAVIRSAADSIYGGLYDGERKTSVQVDGLLVLLGEALVFLDEPNRFLTTDHLLTVLAAVEDLQSVTSRVYDQCEMCLQSTLYHHFNYDDIANTSFGDESVRSPVSSFASPPRNLLKKSVSSLTAVSGFSLIGSEMLESQSRQQDGGRTSVENSGVLIPRPNSKQGAAKVKRGWDWRTRINRDVKGEDILRILRLQIAKGLSFGALAS
ncbi:nuclear pore complex subunit Nup85 [Histoplasma capsulatum]|uniref:Nuclear pore complex protein Nup85 n=1 Tax=Ajellomyces capsulatus TaxID=5037 RepID=A0A8A1M7L5_AJECA|nr:predicted protein [Histoplasma mississippiense (nom. inval.)]EDN07927.1 predicted protein [Histoplasma mississippiense (nom. inval.)]QSS61961.1 nuclear pore complex subunit Nup85 [Histoplasma capsulatum]